MRWIFLFVLTENTTFHINILVNCSGYSLFLKFELFSTKSHKTNFLFFPVNDIMSMIKSYSVVKLFIFSNRLLIPFVGSLTIKLFGYINSNHAMFI